VFKREEYLNKLISWRDEQVIKVVTGIRRCGKSTLLSQYQDYLKENDVSDEQIISLNFEELENEELLDYKSLYNYIKGKLCVGKMTYIFLDEIQNVPSFEKTIDSLYVKDNTDIYITGSNSYLLSGELATLLTGRYVEISILPLSFKEYNELSGGQADIDFVDYLKYGGMPYIATMQKTDEKVSVYMEGIYNTVVIKDIEDRQKKRNAKINTQELSQPQTCNINRQKTITDISLLKTVAKYLSSVVGSLVSVRSVTNYLTSNGRKVSPNTVNDYMEALRESYIFYPADRFDVVGKEILKSNKKWYIVDLGLRNHILPRKNYDLGFSLENIVYFELLRRGYKVNVGKFASREIDFVAQKNGVITYFQVTADMTAQSTFEREINPLRNINDNYEKIILTLDKFSIGNYDGIQVKNLVDWLLK
jgi:hypothetical protein